MNGLKKLLMWKAASGSRDGLPAEYQRVDYCVSTGQLAHADTGVSGSANLRIQCEFLAETQYNYAGILGNFATNTKSWRIILNANSTSIVANANSQNSTVLTPVGGNSIGTKLLVTLDTSSVSIQDSNGTAEKDPPVVAGSDNTANIALGRYTVNPNATGSGTYKIRIYGCKIWENDALIRNFVPCFRKSDNVAGFWDMVGKAFYSSVSQYEFESGND